MDDEPNTQSIPVPAVAIIVPTAWLDLAPNYAELLVERMAVTVVDFYREPS